MPALYPMMSAPENFAPGDCVRKFVNERSVTPFVGVVTQVVPSTYKVWVQWPIEHQQESPETLIKVNPAISGMPTVTRDNGYDSYEKSISERFRGRIPKRVMAHEQMSLRIAHTFATKIVGRMVDDIKDMHDAGLNELQAYNRVYEKFSSTCSDYILRSSVQKVYANLKD